MGMLGSAGTGTMGFDWGLQKLGEKIGSSPLAQQEAIREQRLKQDTSGLLSQLAQTKDPEQQNKLIAFAKELSPNIDMMEVLKGQGAINQIIGQQNELKDRNIAALDKSGNEARINAVRNRMATIEIQKGNKEEAAIIRSLPDSVVTELINERYKSQFEAGGIQSAGQFAEDEAGNKFNVSIGKKGEAIIQPVGHNNPRVGGLEFINSSTGLTASKRLDYEATKRADEVYQTQRVESVAQIPNLQLQKESLNKAIDLLDKVETGGVINTAAYKLEDVFGVGEGNRAELSLIMAENTFNKLKPLFGGVISEGERQAIMEVYSGIGKSEEANMRILKYLNRANDVALYRAKRIAGSQKFEDFQKVIMETPLPQEEGDQVRTPKSWLEFTSGV